MVLEEDLGLLDWDIVMVDVCSVTVGSVLEVLAVYSIGRELVIVPSVIPYKARVLLDEGIKVAKDGFVTLEPGTCMASVHSPPACTDWDVKLWYWNAQFVQSMLVDEEDIIMVSILCVTVEADSCKDDTHSVGF